jgi:AraC family transcriptional regulator
MLDVDTAVRPRSLSVERQIVSRDLERWFTPPSTAGFRLVAQISGTLEVVQRGRPDVRSTVLAGDVCRTPPGSTQPVRWRVPGQPVEQIHIVLPAYGFRPFLRTNDLDRGLASLASRARPDPVVAALAPSLARAVQAGADDLYLDSAAQFLMAHLAAPDAGQPADRGTLRQRQLSQVVSYMRDHLSERIGLDDLAQEAALSRFHFLRAFAATTGQTPHQFLLDLRIEAARRWLATSDDSVAMVGRRSGFPNAKHFAATFRRRTGSSPTEYRRQIRAS